MKTIVMIMFVAVCALSTPADTHYVDADNTTPSAPYLSWETAATNIQDAVDAASSNDTVLVTNGVYDAGGAITPNYSCMNRVCITNAITLESVNGSGHTFIVGEGPAGSNAVRGVYMSAGTLSGFTVTNGHTWILGDFVYDNFGGGVFCMGGSTVQNCLIAGNRVQGNDGDYVYPSGEVSGGGIYCMGGSTVKNCTISNNWAMGGYGGDHSGYDGEGGHGGSGSGGGVYCTGGSTVQNCTISDNSAAGGGGGDGIDGVLGADGGHGGYGGYGYGGGVYCADGSRVQNCTISGNSAAGGDGGGGGVGSDYEPSFGGPGDGGDGGSGGNGEGGGACCSDGTLQDCIIEDNYAFGGPGGYGDYGGAGEYGSGTDGSGGSGGSGYGGGSCMGTLNNCTLSGNVVDGGIGGSDGINPDGSEGYGYGGGSAWGTLNNCIAYFNTATTSGDNWYDSTPEFSYCCTMPHPGGTGNISANPQFVDASTGNYRLAADSPCINIGTNSHAAGDEDLDGNPRVMGGTVDMGAYEYYAGQGDYDEDGLPNDWEALYYGNIINGVTNALCANGLNTVLEAFIAGLVPTDTDAFFEFSGLSNELWWDSVSGRVYSVWWTSNLLSGFQSLESNIPWTGNIFTDTTYNAEDKGFYKIDVRLE